MHLGLMDKTHVYIFLFQRFNVLYGDLFGNVFPWFGNLSISRYTRIDYSKSH